MQEIHHFKTPHIYEDQITKHNVIYKVRENHEYENLSGYITNPLHHDIKATESWTKLHVHIDTCKSVQP